MVVAVLHAQGQRDARLPASLFQQPGTQPVLKEAVGLALVDEESVEAVAVLDQQAGVIGAPVGLVGAEIAFEGPG